MAETRLTRDLDEAMLGGVLAGLAGRYDWDVTLVRIVTVVVALVTGVLPLVAVYLAAWVIVPPASEVGGEPSSDEDGSSEEAPAAVAGSVVDEMTAVVQEAVGRVEEAGKIAAEAVRQAAGEIGEVVRRPRENGGGAGATAEDAGAEGAATGAAGATDGEPE